MRRKKFYVEDLIKKTLQQASALHLIQCAGFSSSLDGTMSAEHVRVTHDDYMKIFSCTWIRV